jgi:hypothetical protein
VLQSCFTSFTFQGNVIVGGGADLPKGNATPGKLSDVGFVDPKDGNGGNYRLSPTSKFKGAASDRKDEGADIDAIERATAGVQ